MIELLSTRKIWIDGLLQVGKVYANACRRKTISLESIGKSKNQRDVLCSIYCVLVALGKCAPIETLDTPVKQELWTEATNNCSDHPTSIMIRYCKAVWALEHLL